MDDSSPAEGQTIRYTLTLLNRGPLAAASIVITDQLPAGVTHLANNSAGTYNPDDRRVDDRHAQQRRQQSPDH